VVFIGLLGELMKTRTGNNEFYQEFYVNSEPSAMKDGLATWPDVRFAFLTAGVPVVHTLKPETKPDWWQSDTTDAIYYHDPSRYMQLINTDAQFAAGVPWALHNENWYLDGLYPWTYRVKSPLEVPNMMDAMIRKQYVAYDSEQAHPPMRSPRWYSYQLDYWDKPDFDWTSEFPGDLVGGDSRSVYAEIRVAIDQLRSVFATSRTIVVGYSLSGIVAYQLAVAGAVDGAVVVASPKPPWTAVVGKKPVPIIAIAGTKDPYLAVEDAQKSANVMGATFIPVPFADHGLASLKLAINQALKVILQK
jgi:hypothetical protein